MQTIYYFAYGSNLDTEQMERRCPRARPVRRATLEGYRLAFGGQSRTWGGGVATLVQDQGTKVSGLLYGLPWEDIAILDRYEGHPHVYERRIMTVVGDRGRRLRAHVYVLPVKDEAQPAGRYLNVIRQAYRRLGFEPMPLASGTARW